MSCYTTSSLRILGEWKEEELVCKGWWDGRQGAPQLRGIGTRVPSWHGWAAGSPGRILGPQRDSAGNQTQALRVGIIRDNVCLSR